MEMPDHLKLIRVDEDGLKNAEGRVGLVPSLDHHSKRIARFPVVRSAVEQGRETGDRLMRSIEAIFSSVQLGDPVLKVDPGELVALALEMDEDILEMCPVLKLPIELVEGLEGSAVSGRPLQHALPGLHRLMGRREPRALEFAQAGSDGRSSLLLGGSIELLLQDVGEGLPRSQTPIEALQIIQRFWCRSVQLVEPLRDLDGALKGLVISARDLPCL